MWAAMKPSRTSLTFFSSGAILTLGYWAVVMAWFGYDDKGAAMVGDGFVFIPGFVQLLWMFLLNTFTNRRMLRSQDSWLETSGSTGAKFLIYFCLIMSLITIGGSVALLMARYVPAEKSLLGFAGVINSTCTFLSSMIIFFGRELDFLNF